MGSIFPRTDWAAVGRAATGGLELEPVILLYWQPLKIYLLATFPSLSAEAEGLLQDFAQDRLLKAGWLGRADMNRGRFRDYLKTSLRNFVLDYLNRREVKQPPIPLETLVEEPVQPERQAEAFDLAWARAVLAETLRRMEADCRKPGAEQPRRTQIWELFRVRLLEPVLQDTESPRYEVLVSQFGLKSPSEASNTLLSGKRIFKGHLQAVIQEYAGQDAATAAEIAELEAFLDRLSQAGGR